MQGNASEFLHNRDSADGGGLEIKKPTPQDLAESALKFAATSAAREEMLQAYQRDGVLPHGANEPISSEVSESVQSKNAIESRESNETPWYKRVTKEDAVEMGKSIVGAVASVFAVKSLYDAPRYLYERFKTRGITIPSFDVAGVQVNEQVIGGGIVQSAQEVIDANHNNTESRRELVAPDVITNRKKLHELETTQRHELTVFREMRAQGEMLTEEQMEREVNLEIEHAHLTAELENRPVAIAIKDLNDRLTLTKDGSEKYSDTRKELARILRENRNIEIVDREKVAQDIQQLLDTALEQKTSGMQTTREILNTAIVGAGAFALRPLAYAGMDAVAFVQEACKVASKEGVDVDVQFLATQFCKKTRMFVDRLRGIDQSETKSAVRKVVDRVGAIAVLAKYTALGSTVSLNNEVLADNLETMAKATIENVPANFSQNVENIANSLRNVGSGVATAVFGEEAYGADLPYGVSEEKGGVMSVDELEQVDGYAREAAKLAEEVPSFVTRVELAIQDWNEGGRTRRNVTGSTPESIQKMLEELQRLHERGVALQNELGDEFPVYSSDIDDEVRAVLSMNINEVPATNSPERSSVLGSQTKEMSSTVQDFLDDVGGLGEPPQETSSETIDERVTRLRNTLEAVSPDNSSMSWSEAPVTESVSGVPIEQGMETAGGGGAWDVAIERHRLSGVDMEYVNKLSPEQQAQFRVSLDNIEDGTYPPADPDNRADMRNRKGLTDPQHALVMVMDYKIASDYLQKLQGR
jgi:hypothetical protein